MVIAMAEKGHVHKYKDHGARWKPMKVGNEWVVFQPTKCDCGAVGNNRVVSRKPYIKRTDDPRDNRK